MRRYQVWLAALVIVVVGAIVYANSFQGTFVFDDLSSITENPNLPRTRPIERLMKFLGEGMRPVVNATIVLNYLAGQYDPVGYHAVNLLIHVAAGLTLFGILRRTLLSPRLRDRFGAAATSLALAATLIWLVHPLLTQSVTYIIQRAEAMMGLFYLLTLYCVIRGTTSSGADAAGNRAEKQAREQAHSIEDAGLPFGAAAPGQRRREASPCGRQGLWYVLAIASCALGMGSKQVMVTAPLIVLTYDRIFLARSWREIARRGWWLYGSLAATWGLLLGLVYFSPPFMTAGFELKSLTWWQYALSQFGVIAHYLRLSFWPVGLSIDYGWPVADTAVRIVPPGLLIGALLAATLLGLMRRPEAGFAGAWFFLILAPTSSIMPIKDLAFEQRMYLPLAAVVVLVVLGGYAAIRRAAARLGRSARSGDIVAAATAGVVVIALGCGTVLRNRDYRSPLAIWEAAARVCRNNSRAHENWGESLRIAGQATAPGNPLEAQRLLRAAIEEFDRATDLDPANFEAINNRGSAYGQLAIITKDEKLFDKAIADFNAALAIDQTYADAYCNRGNAHKKLGEIALKAGQTERAQSFADLALADFDRAVEVRPGWWGSYHARAAFYFSRKQYLKAWEDLRTCIRLGGRPKRAFVAELIGALDKLGNQPMEIP